MQIIGLGELLWDVFSDGERLGGAPANVAYHAAALGDRGAIASRVGRDARGDEAVRVLAAAGVDTSLVQRDDRRATGTAQVSGDGGEVSFVIDEEAAWTAPTWSEAWERAIAGCDALCFGSLAGATEAGRSVLTRAARAAAPSLRVLDLNLRPPLTSGGAVAAAMRSANVLKVSEDEAAVVSRELAGGDLVDWALSQGFRALAITRGARGCALYTPSGHAEHPGFEIDDGAGDPVGAGDAFTAALTHQLLRGNQPEEICRAAARYAAYVASQRGAMPAIPDAIAAEVVGRGRGAAD